MKVSSPKFKPRFIGPYKISEVLNPVSFRLALPASFAIHNVFHRSLLQRYVAPMVPSVDPPAPVLVEGELEYVVEKILDSRISRRKLQYLVKWKGYGQEDNSWVVASDVHAADLVRAFHLARPDRPGGSGEGSVTPPQGGGTVVNSVIELPPVVMNGTSASSVHGLPLVAVSGAAGSEVPSTACYHDFALLAGSSGMQSGTSALWSYIDSPTELWYKDCPEYCTKYEHILNKCSFDIITLTIEHLQKAINTSSEAIKTIEAQLSSSGSPEELTTLRDQISKNIEKHRRETEERKRMKFNRDTEDYERQQVYRWQDSFFARRISTRQAPRTSLDYSTSGSEQEQERQALHGLQIDKNLIIKPADKGGALVIMNKSDYLLEIRRQLDNPTIYVKLPRDPMPVTRQLISDTLLKYTELGVLDPKTCDFLTNPHPITPVFYTIPKIHKNLEKPPGRPIVASTDSILSPLAVYLEKILTPLIRLSKSYILDTGSFLNILKELGPIPPGSILVTMDVKDLYTSIPHIGGINSVHKLLTKSNFVPDQINLCVELLTIILTRNYFMFQDDFYLQIRGTAMGSNVAPPYANCYMADFEESHIYSHPLFSNNVIVWKRYIDDVFCIWGGTMEALASFFGWLNTAWPGISFTMSHDDTRINFLDTMVILQSDGSISTDLYTKSTDRDRLLHFTSFHPPATKKSVPKSQFQRVSKIVSDGELRPLRLQEMTTKFSQRGYPSS
ncbi:unnamed protein product, partial [Ranitomeya imitator]